MLTEAIDKIREMLNGIVPPFEVPASGHTSKRFIPLPNNYSLVQVPQRPDIPHELQQQVLCDELESFAAYLNRYGTPEATVIFLQLTETTVAMDAVLDYHRPITGDDVALFEPLPGTAILPQWCKHKAAFRPVMTAEWKLWTSNEHHKKAKEQIQFAQFLEENRVDILKPEAADLIETCRALTVMKSVNYSKVERDLSGNVTLHYSEESKPKGKIEVPEEMTLYIAPYQGEARMEVPAKLRYRLDSGTCWFAYEILRPHKVLEACAIEMREQIAALTEKRFPIYSGRPA